MAHSVEVLIPAQRYVFALENGHAELLPTPTSADGFLAYKRLQTEGKVAAMIAIPNCCLVRAGKDYVVDPGLIMQGAPVTSSLRARGIEPHETKVILTHTHFDHIEALVEFARRETYVHEIELEAPYTAILQSVIDMVRPEADRRGGRDRARPALDPHARPPRRPDLVPGGHRRRPGRDRLATASARCPSTSTRWTCRRTSAPSATSCCTSGSGSATWTPTW